MQCNFCKDPVPEWDKPNKVHLCLSKSSTDHVHIHGDLDNKKEMRDLIEQASADLEIIKPGVLARKEIVFHNRQRIGDILMFTCAIRDFKRAYPDVRVNVISTAMHIWDHNPYIDRDLAATDENTVKIGPGWLTNASNRIDWHFANAYRVSMEQALNIQIPQGESRPDIWFTEEEYNAPRITDKPYWIICTTGERGWGCKMYPFERWQDFVSQNPDTLFYQIGAKGDNPPRLKGANVVDYVGKTEDRHTGVRELFKLFLNAEGSIGLVSFHMHLSGALNKPCIVVAGAREPVAFTRYAGHQYIATDGTLPCATQACWHCALDACTNLVDHKVPKCVDMIQVSELTDALNRYYIGGRLIKGVASAKPKIKNLTKTPLIAPLSTPLVGVPDITKYGMNYGGGSITDRDWLFIEKVIKEYKIESVLEFGSGLSTLLLQDYKDVKKLVSFETQEGWNRKLKELKPELDVRLWDGKDAKINEPFDLAFVDGPAGGINREFSTKTASELARIVLVHDANREHELNWQEKYLKAGFSGPFKGGHRCHLWIKQEQPAKVEPLPVTDPNSGEKSVKIVSTARGWGGCARSVTTIMKMLVERGHTVEFIPFRNQVSSREFKEFLLNWPKIRVNESYEAIKGPCDTLLVYADDFVWEFPKPELAPVFADIQAKKKVMMANFRLGDIGKVPWTKGWDHYMFLNSTQEEALLKRLPGAKTTVLPPCTDLEPFLRIQPSYNSGLRIVRHNSQGDVKFAKNDENDKLRVQGEIYQTLSWRDDASIEMMPGPSFVPEVPRFKKVPRNTPPIPDFLRRGNLFWYSLPAGYIDAGPRVVIEAMAAGLPILADNWGGAKDRVTPDCGWLCNSKEEHLEILKHVTKEELEAKGKAAKARARKEFIPERWVEILVGA